MAHWEMLYKWIVQWEQFESHSGFSSKPCLMTQKKGRSYNAWFHSMVILWMVAKSCTTWDGRTPINNGINHVLTDAGFRNHPLYFMRHVIGTPLKRQLNRREIWGYHGRSSRWATTNGQLKRRKFPWMFHIIQWFLTVPSISGNFRVLYT